MPTIERLLATPYPRIGTAFGVLTIFISLLSASVWAFEPEISSRGSVVSLAIQEDGKILVGRNHVIAGPFQGERNTILRLNSGGSEDQTFDVGAGVIIREGTGSDIVNAIAIQSDGKILIGGFFRIVDGIARNGIARLNSDGSVDETFESGLRTFGLNGVDTIYSIWVQADGKILIAGSFSETIGQPQRGIARLNPDGSADLAFNRNVSLDGAVFDSLLLADGRIVIGGNFTQANGVSRNRIARLNADGSLDQTFNPAPGANHIVRELELQVDEKILISGQFTEINGMAREGVARLNSDGSLDEAFVVSPNGSIASILEQPDGKILIGGSFNQVSGLRRNSIARLNSDGGVDQSFGRTGGVDSGYVQSIALAEDGKILIGGKFTSVDGASRTNVARLNADGSVDGDDQFCTAVKSANGNLALICL